MSVKEKTFTLKIAIILFLLLTILLILPLSAAILLTANILFSRFSSDSPDFLMFIAIAIIILISNIVLAIFLWKGKNWARLAATLEFIIISFFMLIFSSIDHSPLFLYIIFFILILGFLFLLWFDKRINNYFETTPILLPKLFESIKSGWPKKPSKIKFLLEMYGFTIIVWLFILGSFFLYGLNRTNITLIILFLGIIFLNFIIIYLVWIRNKWGRALGLIGAILIFLEPPLGIIIGLVILYLLLIDKEVKKYFEK